MHANLEGQFTALPSTPDRVAMYAGVHKGLRDAMHANLSAVGRLDVDDDAELARVVDGMGDLLRMLATHLEDENRFLQPALLPFGGGLATRHDHADHERSLDELHGLVDGLAASPREQRRARARLLYRALALFVAENLVHMDVEETENQAAFERHFSDDELHALHGRLVASIPPDTMMLFLRWMLPAIPHEERVAMLKGLLQKSPAAATGAYALARAHLAPADLRKLDIALAAR